MRTMAADLLADLTALGIEVVARGDRLRYRPRSALTPDLAERLKTHKAELLAILRLGGPAAANPTPAAEDAGPVGTRPDPAKQAPQREDCIEPPDACPACGELLCWWNPLGDRRCVVCDPPITAIRLLGRAEQIRRRQRIPRPAGAVETLTGLKQRTSYLTTR